MDEPVRVVLGRAVAVRGLGERDEAAIKAACEFPNPEHAKLERLGKWTGDTDRVIRCWSDVNGWLVVPTGAEDLVMRAASVAGRPVALEDRTAIPGLARIARPTGVLYDYQGAALESLLRRRSGMLVAPPGSGKTNVLLTAAARLETPTLVVVHTRELVAQTVERCRSWLGVEPDVVGGGHSRLSDEPPAVTVATVQSLAASGRRRAIELRGRFGAVMVDENHHSSARTWSAVLGELSARYKYGFTATPRRKDGLDRLAELATGPIAATVSTDDVVAAGRIVRPSVEFVETAWAGRLQSTDEWTRAVTALARDAERNALVVREVYRRLRDGARRALILTDRVDHVAELAFRCEPGAVWITGATPAGERGLLMDLVRRGSVPVTIATTGVMGEGVDVPGWDLVALATPFAAGARLTQAVGRVARAASGKTGALVVDFVDARVPILAAAARGRERAYREAGCEPINRR
jgi:superfamily II DNA or RNA helicase